jgi:hypothetical protein
MIKFKADVRFDVEKARRAIMEHKAEGLRKLAEYVAEMARVFCPVKSGDLQRSITVVPGMGGLQWFVIVTMPYAEPVEFGHINALTGRSVPANPFLRRALRLGALKFPQYVGGAKVEKGFEEGRALRVKFAA